MAPRSDLLDHYKLDAEQIGESVIHCSYTSDRARGLRKVKLEQRWDNVKPIGYGSFGEIWQQKQSDSNEQRAVKILRKRPMKSWGIDYEREIEALAKFDKAQVSFSSLTISDFTHLSLEAIAQHKNPHEKAKHAEIIYSTSAFEG